MWLREWCARTGPGGAPAAAGAGDDALALAACRVLFLGRSPDEAAAELFDLLGDNAFEAIGELMEHRWGAKGCHYAVREPGNYV